ncbi:MAG: DMT family transporter [Chloroflexi bacterium]|nr:DMT family transporter [Chloroflexota bacterium]MCL5274223.1 DMT family transporter [Chloroflexota bacterium]
MDIFGILVLALIWGSSFLFIKIGLNGGMSPLLVATWRLAVGAAVMWGIVGVRQLIAPATFKQPAPTGRATWAKIAIVGLVNNAIPFALIAWGEQRISSGLASIFNASMPLFTVIVAHFFTHDDRIIPLKAAGVFVGLAGVAVVIAPTAGDFSGELLGSLAVIVASLSYAAATVFVKKNLTGATDPIATGAGQLVTALVWLAPLALLTHATANIGALPVSAMLAVTVLGFFGTGLAYVIYYLIIQRAKASQLSLVTYLLPVTALIYGAAFLNEQVTPFALIGFVLIVAGIALVNRANNTVQSIPKPGAAR